MFEYLDSSLFDWLTWRTGSPIDVFGLACRTYDLLRGKHILRQYAIGWCPAEKLLCRPKKGAVAVMFLKNDQFFWFHLYREEFQKIFMA